MRAARALELAGYDVRVARRGGCRTGELDQPSAVVGVVAALLASSGAYFLYTSVAFGWQGIGPSAGSADRTR